MFRLYLAAGLFLVGSTEAGTNVFLINKLKRSLASRIFGRATCLTRLQTSHSLFFITIMGQEVGILCPPVVCVFFFSSVSYSWWAENSCGDSGKAQLSRHSERLIKQHTLKAYKTKLYITRDRSFQRCSDRP